MDTRLFRYLFQNTSNAIVMTGCTWDKGAQEQSRYAYSCEMSHNNWRVNKRNGIKHVICGSSPVNLFVMGAFSIEDCERLNPSWEPGYGDHPIRSAPPEVFADPDDGRAGDARQRGCAVY